MIRWSERWLALLDDGGGLVSRRFAQGRQLLRSGRVSAIKVATGVITARVQGSHATPLAVEVTIEPLDDRAWATVAQVLGSQVRHRARLLAGQVPEGLEAQLAAAGVSLVPRRDEIDMRCGCRDSIEPCAHVAALWLAVAGMLDDDPFVLLRVRGRGRDRLLAETAAARGSTSLRAAGAVATAALDTDRWTAPGGDFSELELPVPPESRTVAGPLRVLGDPPGWEGAHDPAGLFGDLVRRGARWARATLDGDEDQQPLG